MMASIQATLYNAHFDTQGVPFTPEDLLGTGDRAKRKAKATRGRMEALKLTAELAKQKPGDTENLPDWAKDLGRSKGLIN